MHYSSLIVFIFRSFTIILSVRMCCAERIEQFCLSFDIICTLFLEVEDKPADLSTRIIFKPREKPAFENQDSKTNKRVSSETKPIPKKQKKKAVLSFDEEENDEQVSYSIYRSVLDRYTHIWQILNVFDSYVGLISYAFYGIYLFNNQ